MPLFDDKFPSLSDSAKRLDGEVSSIQRARVRRGLRTSNEPPEVSGFGVSADSKDIIVQDPRMPTSERNVYIPDDVDEAAARPFAGTVLNPTTIRVGEGKIFGYIVLEPAVGIWTTIAQTDVTIDKTFGFIWARVEGAWDIVGNPELVDIPAPGGGDPIQLRVTQRRYSPSAATYITDDPPATGSEPDTVFYVPILYYDTVDSELTVVEAITESHIIIQEVHTQIS